MTEKEGKEFRGFFGFWAASGRWNRDRRLDFARGVVRQVDSLAHRVTDGGAASGGRDWSTPRGIRANDVENRCTKFTESRQCAGDVSQSRAALSSMNPFCALTQS